MSHLPAATLGPSITVEQLPDDAATLKSMILELVAALQQRDRDHEAMRHRLDMLLRRLYGPRGERFDPNQLLLFPDESADPVVPPPVQPPAPPDETKPKRTCRPHGRRRLPENLPRVPKHYELTQAERICLKCGQQRQDIGTDTSEQLDYKPASLFVIQHIVHKYLCPCCSKAREQALPTGPASTPGQQGTTLPEVPSPSMPPRVASLQEQEPMTKPTDSSLPAGEPTEQATPTPVEFPRVAPTAPLVITASKPAQPIAKGIAGPGLLAHLIVAKYVEHMPLNRLENHYARQGVFMPRSTLCDWLMASARLLWPLYDRLVYWALLSRALHTDDTPVKLQNPKTHQLSTARMWVYLGDDAHPYNVFDFTLNRKRDGPQQFLKDYRGYLHADAFSGYDCLYLPDPLTTKSRIIEVACNAHARRKFFDSQTSDLARSHVALGYYRQLYELERGAKEFSAAAKLQMRRDLAVPILAQMREWIDKTHADVLPKSPLGEAFGYVRNNWSALVRYTEAGYLAIDNNVSEREMKRVAIGRKNWLFVGSPEGGKMAAVMMSFTSTCHRLSVEPWAYLQDVLTRLPATSGDHRLDELLPDRWQASRGKEAETSSSAPRASGPSSEEVP
jgi:transposase